MPDGINNVIKPTKAIPASKKAPPKSINVEKSLALQSKMTNLVFDIINQGNVDFLKKEQLRLGFSKPEEISNLIDEESQS